MKGYIKLIVTVIFGVLLNLLGHKLTAVISMPFWLDTIGTMITACAYGPVAGGAVGLISNLSFGGISVTFAIVNVVIGVIIGFLARKGLCDTLFGSLCTGILIGLITVACSVPVNYMIYDGNTGNEWGRALFDMLSQYRIGKLFKAVISQIFIDIPDKVISMAVAFFTVRLMKKCRFLPERNGAENV